jgi:hypothetical protein
MVAEQIDDPIGHKVTISRAIRSLRARDPGEVSRV